MTSPAYCLPSETINGVSVSQLWRASVRLVRAVRAAVQRGRPGLSLLLVTKVTVTYVTYKSVTVILVTSRTLFLAMPPEVAAFIARLRTVPEYATEQNISRVQAHRRIAEGKASTVEIRGRLFIVLPETP